MSKIKDWVYDQGLLLQEFCDMVGVHRTMIYLWRKGKKRPGPRTMMKIKEITKGAINSPKDLLD